MEQYYTQEDVQETPNQALENFTATANSLANVVPEVAIALNEAGAALGELYAKAEAAGDTSAMQNISLAWTRAEEIANQTVQLDAARQAAIAAISTINDERLKVSELYDGVIDAIYDQDETHPELKDFAQAIRYDHEAVMMEEAEEIALEWATDVTWEQVHEGIARVTKCTWQQVNKFMAVLQGDDISDINAALLKELIEHLD